MRQGYLLGIDIGTTSTKVTLIDLLGHVAAEASLPTTLHSPQPGWAEEDPEQWWGNVCAAVPACLAKAGVEPSRVLAVGASGMVPTVILLDAAGQVLAPSIQQNDARALEQIAHFQAHTDAADILTRTGSAVTQQSVGPKLLWLRQHRPQAMAQAAHVLGSYDFVAHRLSDAFSAERNWALESGLYDLEREDWDDALLELASIKRTQLPPVRTPAEVIGKVTPAAAQATGLLAGTPVVAGSADHIASAFSAGLRDHGDLLVKLGGAGDILYCIDHPLVDARLYLDYHVIPGKYLLNGCMATSGSLIRWFQGQFAQGASLADLDKAAEAIPAGSDGLILLPYFLGEKTPIHDPQARGTLVGLTLSHTSAHVYRAVLEGIAYGFYHHLEVLRTRGLGASRARVTNGGARSQLWKQIVADVIGLPLDQVAGHPGSSLGAAFVAGMGVGAFDDWADIERYIHIASTSEPDHTRHAHYQRQFALYREVYESLKDTYPKLA